MTRLDVNVNAGLEVRQSGKADDPLARHTDLKLSLGNLKGSSHARSVTVFWGKLTLNQ